MVFLKLDNNANTIKNIVDCCFILFIISICFW